MNVAAMVVVVLNLTWRIATCDIPSQKSPDGLPFRLYERRDRRYVSYRYGYKNGHWLVQGIKKAMREAVRKATLINTGNCLRETVAVLIDRYFDWQDAMSFTAELRKAQSPLAENRRESKNLKRFLGEMMPDTVKARHCYAYQDLKDLRIHESAGAKANKELSLLSAVFEYGRRVGVVDENPCRGIQRVPVCPRDF